MNDNDLNMNVPELVSWSITSWEWFFITIKMKFSFPLYISNQPRIDDELEIRFIQNTIFRALIDD